MIKHSWYAERYQWPPEVVDELWEDDDYWLPLIAEARDRVQEMRAKEAQRQQDGR